MEPYEDANFTCGDAPENCTSNDLYASCVQNGTLEIIATALNFYYMPILIIFGCLGNLISIFVFRTSKLRLQSTSIYLSALALSDTLFLIQLLPPWLKTTLLSNIFHRPGVCQVVVYISYVCCFISTWTVVAFTVERLVAVLYPLQRSLICTVQRAKYIVLAVVLAALILNIPVLRFTAPDTNECNVNNDYLDDAARFNLVDTIIVFTVPLAAIVVLNIRIMMGVRRLERTRHQLMKAHEPGSNHSRLTQLGVKSQTRVTRMLLLVSSVFVVFNLPAYTMRIIAYAYDMNREVLGDRWPAYQQLAMAFFNTNFGISFMLYCLSGQNFRNALYNTIPWLRRRAMRAAAAARRTACNPARASISTSYASAATDRANTMSLATVSMEEPAVVRRHRSEPVISRWTFDNRRQRNAIQQEPIEMETFSRGNDSTGNKHGI